MSKFHISINQFTEFSASTNSRKIAIIKNQIKPNGLLIPWYQSAKGSMKKYLTNVNDLAPIYDGIDKLIQKNPQNKRQTIDKQVSIEALQKLIQLKVSRLLKGIKYEVIKPELKAININDVDITISPEIIIKVYLGDKIVYGGIKIHISKGKPFTHTQCKYVSTLLSEYIKAKVAKGKEVVDPKLCLCIDIFGERIVTASKEYSEELNEIQQLCEEIKQIWSDVA